MFKRLFFSAFIAIPVSFFTSFAIADDNALKLQRILAEQGYYTGALDGKFGPNSKKALNNFCSKTKQACNPEQLQTTLQTLKQNGFESEPLYSVPVFDEFDFPISKPNVLLVDVNSGNFSRCKHTVQNNLRTYRYDYDSILSASALLFEPDIYKAAGKNFDVLDPITNDFGSRIYKQGHACLKGETNACWATIKVVDKMRTSNALLNNTSNSTPETHYLTVDRILSPLLVSYSYAIQRVGRPKSDYANSTWFKNVIYQNTYDPRPKARNRERDFERSGLGNCSGDLRSAAGQNHHTASGLMYQMWGVLWGNSNYAAIGLDAVNAALKSVDAQGALVCDAARGANAMTYQGRNISNMTASLLIAKNQGVDLTQLSHLENYHKAVNFQLSLILDQTPIFKYARRNIGAWCNKNYKEQCFHIAGHRDEAFSWAIPYMKLFPEHENTKAMKSMFKTITRDRNLDEETKRNLNGFVAGKIPTDKYRRNIFYQNQWDRDDSKAYLFDDFAFPMRGSAVCMFGIAKY